MALGRVNHIHFGVDDLEETVKYFTEGLGFKRIESKIGEEAVRLRTPAGDLIFDFVQTTEEEYRKNVAPRKHYFYHVGFEVDDIDKACEELKSKGASFVSTPARRPHYGRNVAETSTSPDGKRVWIQLVELLEGGE